MKFSLLIAACLVASVLGKKEPPTPPPMDMDPPAPPGPPMDMEDIHFAPPLNDTLSDDWMFMGSGSEERFEGDMVLTDEQLRQLNGTADVERNGLTNTGARWPNAVVPYTIASSFSNSERNRIRQAMDDYEARTCITFVERTNQANYVRIFESGGCWSYVGRIGGGQRLSLGSGCVSNKIIQHELMHAIGFFHEQSRCDRDDYVEILTQNIQSGRQNNFNKYTCSQVTAFGETYDYVSAMHYGKYAFSRNGQPTIQARDNPSRTLGNSVGLTDIDVAKLNSMYECSTTSSSTSSTASTTSATTYATTTVSPSGSCTDLFTGDDQCSYWASTDEYSCTSERDGSWMKTYCRASCNECDNCADTSTSCSRRQRRGECERPSRVMAMMRMCAETCGYCGDSL